MIAGVVLFGLVFVCLRKKWKLKGCYDRNGGQMLEKTGVKIFTKQELDKITNNKSNKIGKGAFGVVYKGTHDDQPSPSSTPSKRAYHGLVARMSS